MSEIQATVGNPPTPSSVNHLQLERDRSRKQVNEFLDRWHPLGGVTGWKACFTAMYRGHRVAVVVVGRPVARHAPDTELSITRFARRDDRPDNTGSWLISKARRWAELEGYETITAHSGVAGNFGTVYEACGFELIDVVEQADGDGWDSREGRETFGTYTRRKWSCSLGL